MERRTASPTGDWAARFLWLLMTLALIALALYVVWAVRHVITLMLVCGAIAYLLIPLVDWLARWRPRWIAPLAWRGVVSLVATLAFWRSPSSRSAPRESYSSTPETRRRCEGCILLPSLHLHEAVRDGRGFSCRCHGAR